jgi:hypothetical protein
MKSIASRLSAILCTVVAVGATFVATTADAHAYIDPGTGAMILQIIGAVVAGALFYFRQIRAMIAAWFARLTSRAPRGDNNT